MALEMKPEWWSTGSLFQTDGLVVPGLVRWPELRACEQDRGHCGWGLVNEMRHFGRGDWAGQQCSSPGGTQQASSWPRPHPRPVHQTLWWDPGITIFTGLPS